MKTLDPREFDFFSRTRSPFQILESISDGFYFLDTNWNFVYLNQAAEVMLGHTFDSLRGRNVWEMFPEAKQTDLFKGYCKAAASNITGSFELFYPPFDLWVNVTAYPSKEGLAVFFVNITQKKKLTSEVAFHKNQHANIINSSADAIWSVDTGYRLLAANSVFLQNTLRYSGKELNLGDNILTVMGKEEGKKWKPLYDRALAGEQVTDDKLLTFLPPGGEVYTAIIFNPIKNEQESRVYGVACYARDITESKHYIKFIEDSNKRLQEQELKLLELSNRLESILNNSLDIIASLDEEDRYVSMNHSSEDILGIKPSDMIGRHITDFVYAADIDKTLQVAKDIRRGLQITDFENRLVKLDGTSVPILWSAKWHEALQLTFCVGRDATELYKAQQQKMESEQRFAALVSKGADMVCIIDTLGVYKYVSSNIEQVYGYKPSDLLNTNAFDLVHAEDVSRVREQFEKELIHKEQAVESFRIKNAVGEWRWIEAICSHMTDNEAVDGIIINSRDVTERKENETKLKEAFNALSAQNAVLNDIAFVQSHEVRKPLANILGLTQLILDHDATGELTPMIIHLKESADQLDIIIRKIVDTSYTVRMHENTENHLST